MPPSLVLPMENALLPLLCLSGAVLGFTLVSARTQCWPVTGPMVALAAGLLLQALGGGATGDPGLLVWIDGLAELSLALVLFCDASRIVPSRLRAGAGLPVRLLGIGMPLTIAAGATLAWLVEPTLGWAGCLLVGIALAPTDAALGQAVMTQPAVPARVRQALNVESGLNDGLAFPALIVVAGLAGSVDTASSTGGLTLAIGGQVVLGPLAGLAVGWSAAWLMARAQAADAVAAGVGRASVIPVAFAAFTVAELVGGNGFLSAFVAGSVAGARSKEIKASARKFGEAEGHLLILAVFFLLGAVLTPSFVDATHWSGIWGMPLVYGLLSLTVVRMLPVAVALWGTGLRPSSVLFIGWFGPRGTASVIYLLLAGTTYGLPQAEAIAPYVLATVLLSVLLHGVSAAPLSRRFGRQLRADPVNTEPPGPGPSLREGPGV